MPYHDGQDDEDDGDPLDDREGPDESDIDPGEAVETNPCPYCGKDIYEAAEVCPHCGSFVSSEDAPPRRPGWLLIAVVACIVAVLIGVVSYV